VIRRFRRSVAGFESALRNYHGWILVESHTQQGLSRKVLSRLRSNDIQPAPRVCLRRLNRNSLDGDSLRTPQLITAGDPAWAYL